MLLTSRGATTLGNTEQTTQAPSRPRGLIRTTLELNLSYLGDRRDTCTYTDTIILIGL